MGKPTGFMDYERQACVSADPKERIKNFNEFHIHLDVYKRQILKRLCGIGNVTYTTGIASDTA